MPRLVQWRYINLTVEQMLALAPDPETVHTPITSALPDADRRSVTTIAALIRPVMVPALAIGGRFAAAALGRTPRSSSTPATTTSSRRPSPKTTTQPCPGARRICRA